MAKFTQEDLARMHAEAMNNALFIQERKLAGGSVAEAMNELFDKPMVVGAVWRKKRGGYDMTPLKGLEHLERVARTGIPESISFLYFDPGSAAEAYAIQLIYRERPEARWFDGGAKMGEHLLGLR